MPSDVVRYAVCGLCGVAFGIAAEKGRVHEPYLIRGQMDFSYFVMLKMFLGATATGMASLSLLNMFSSTGKRRFQDARVEYMSCLRNKGYLSAALGGALLGTGMTLAGACPGMVLVQVGSGLHNSLYTLAGGFTAVLLYSVLEPTLVALTRPSGFSSHQTLDDRRSYQSTALPMAAVLGCVVAGCEIYRPWTSDVQTSWVAGNILSTRAWAPYISGAIIGALQPIVVMTCSDTLGTSSSYCTMMSQFLVTRRLRDAFPYLAKYKTGFMNWWQVIFVGGAVVGAYISASSSRSLYMSSPVTKSQAVIGGLCMVFGARLAGGCTSGHGLSGMALLVFNSFTAVAAMFAGAMATYAAMQKGLLNI